MKTFTKLAVLLILACFVGSCATSSKEENHEHHEKHEKKDKKDKD